MVLLASSASVVIIIIVVVMNDKNLRLVIFFILNKISSIKYLTNIFAHKQKVRARDKTELGRPKEPINKFDDLKIRTDPWSET